MTLNSKALAVIIIVLLFGGIVLSSVLGWWQTESTKQPVTYTEGEFAGQANPVDIRGSYTFGDIAQAFAISPEILAQAFGVTTDDPAAFQVKNLEELYADSPVEIGTASVRLFVACYLGLPYDLTTAEATYLPASAVEILNTQGRPTPEQQAWLATHGAPAAPPTAAPEQATPTPHATAEASAYTIKGKTTFGELLQWGVPPAVIEQHLGGPLPDPAVTLKDYASAQGLDFESLKTALQAEVDKVKP